MIFAFVIILHPNVVRHSHKDKDNFRYFIHLKSIFVFVYDADLTSASYM